MRRTSSALTRASSGCGRPMSAKTLPLPASTRMDSLAVAFADALLSLDPFRIVALGSSQSGADPLDVAGRCLGPRFRLLPEDVEDVYSAGKFDGVNGPERTSIVILDHFQHP